MSGFIYLTFLFVFTRVGLIPSLFCYAGDVDVRRASDQAGDQSTRIDRMGAWTTDDHHARAKKEAL